MFDELFHFPPDRNAQQVCPKQPKQSLGLALPSQLQAGLEIEQVYSRLICNLITFYKPFKIYLNLSYREKKKLQKQRERGILCLLVHSQDEENSQDQSNGRKQKLLPGPSSR